MLFAIFDMNDKRTKVLMDSVMVLLLIHVIKTTGSKWGMVYLDTKHLVKSQLTLKENLFVKQITIKQSEL